jgi:hypothetical protein
MDGQPQNTLSGALQELPLLRVIRDLQSDFASAEDLLQACEAAQQDLAQLRSDFEVALQAEHESLRPLLGPEVEAVYRSFEDYNALLLSCASYAQDFDAGRLESTLQGAPAAAVRLSLDFGRFREAALAQRGPSTHPGLNLVYTTATLLRRGETSPELWHQTLEGELQRAQDWLEQDFSKFHAGAEVADFYQRYLELLDHPPGEEGWDEWLEWLLELGKDFARVDGDALRRRYGHGPSAVPWVNLLVNGAWLVGQNSVSANLLRDFVFEAQTELVRVNDAFSSWAQNQEQAQNAADLLLQLEEWLTALDGWLDTADPDGLDGLAQQGLQLAGRYPELQQALEGSAGGRNVSSSCNLCGGPVREGRCANCGARSFASSEVAAEATAEAGGRIERLLDQARVVLQEAGDVAAFRSAVESLERDLKIARAKDPGPDQDEGCAELRDRYVAALDQFEEALGHLRDFCDEPSAGALEAAEQPLRDSAAELLGLQTDLAQAGKPSV